MKVFAPALAALSLSAASLSAHALTSADMYGQPAESSYAERTIVVTPATKYINVAHGEVANIKVGDREFAWNFDGVAARSFELNRVAPEGTLDHTVRVYVGTTVQDGGLGE